MEEVFHSIFILFYKYNLVSLSRERSNTWREIGSSVVLFFVHRWHVLNQISDMKNTFTGDYSPYA